MGTETSGVHRHSGSERILDLTDIRNAWRQDTLTTDDVRLLYVQLLGFDPSAASRLVQTDEGMFGCTGVQFDFLRHAGFIPDAQFCTSHIRSLIGNVHGDLVAGVGPGKSEESLVRTYDVRGHQIILELSGDTFPPSRTTQLFARNVAVHPGDRFFEVGFGSFYLSILAKKLGAGKIGGSEMDERAFAPARNNAVRNGIDADAMELHQCNLFPDDLEPQDVIAANVPQTPSIPSKALPHIDAGKDGTDILMRLLQAAPKFMHAQTRLYIAVASIANAPKVMSFINEHFQARVLAQQELPLPPYVLDRMDHFLSLQGGGVCDVFQKDNRWYSRDTLLELQRKP